MDLLLACTRIENFFAYPSTVLFLIVGIFLTIKTGLVQIRALPRVIRLLTKGVEQTDNVDEKTINPFHALFTAMASTIGMGNIVGPSIAVVIGGPGALFWLVAYAFFGSVVKYSEVVFAITLRKVLPDGSILAGPTQYLRDISPLLGVWYGGVTVFLFAGWSGLQANTLASIFYLEGVDKWITGALLAGIVFVVLLGGIKRIGEVASKLVPFMFVLYVCFACFILLQDLAVLRHAFDLIFQHMFTPCAAVGGFVGATVFSAISTGIHKSAYITESGLGTSCIAHAMSDTDKPKDQAILAMFSVIADMILSVLSGLLVIVTGIWTRGQFSNTLIYEVFCDYSPAMGKWVLLASITLFVLTTTIGNSFSASQSFASFTKYRGIFWYYVFLSVIIFVGALVQVPLAWKIMDLLLIMVAIPHLIGLILLSFKHGKLIK